MALYIDIHNLPSVISGAATEAHARDLQTRAGREVDYQSYWVDVHEGKIFCLVEAPDMEAAAAVHSDAQGLVADRIFEVQEGS